LEICAAAEADIQSVLDLWQLAESPPSATDDNGSLGQLLERDPGALLLAEADGDIVGSLIAAWDGWRGSFYRLAVNPESRRRGIATALIRAGENRLRALGASRLTAIVAENEVAAMALWRSAGYERQAEVGRFVRMLTE
jgi:ribosomal protein S18 acetylase RimI-like enzyme